MKSDRLMSALLLLQAHRRLSTKEIAEKLEVSHRTAHRDMESLCMAGVPLVAHRGSQGGWELDKNWKTEIPGLDTKELESLLMLQPSLLGDRKLAAAAERAFEKLVASLPKSMQTQANTIRARLHIDSSDWWVDGEDLSLLPTVQQSVLSDRKLNFMYTKSDDDCRSRTVDPLGLVCKQSVWYLVARTPRGMRTYRVSRMSDVVILTLPVKRPGRFDLAKYWKRSAEELKSKRTRMKTTIALTKKAARQLGPWVAYTLLREDADGWQIFNIDFAVPDQALFFVMGLGSQAKVLDPPELRSLVRAEHMRAHHLYPR